MRQCDGKRGDQEGEKAFRVERTVQVETGDCKTAWNV